LTWVSQNTDLLESIRGYVRAFEKEKPLIFRYFSDGESPLFNFPVVSEEGTKLLLLYSALNQNIGESDLSQLLVKLYEEHSDKIFLLNEITFETLRKSIDAFSPSSLWNIRKRAPGIIRSVCDFFLVHGNLIQLINNLSSSEDMVKLLSDEIFFMGKSSIMKFKSRFFVWMINCAHQENQKEFWDRKSLLPTTSGANRFMYFIGPLKSRDSVKFTMEEKLDYFNRFYKLLFQNESWKVYPAFDAFKKKSSPHTYECQRIMSGCVCCPVNKYCNTQ
jgi:hypothetical protein